MSDIPIEGAEEDDELAEQLREPHRGPSSPPSEHADPRRLRTDPEFDEEEPEKTRPPVHGDT